MLAPNSKQFHAISQSLSYLTARADTFQPFDFMGITPNTTPLG